MHSVVPHAVHFVVSHVVFAVVCHVHFVALFMYDMLHSLLQLNDVHFVVSHVAHFVLSHVVCEMCLFNALSYSEEITLMNQLISIFNQLSYCCITCFTLF